MNTKIRFLSEGNEVKKSSFPHRTFHKDSLHVGSKLIPVHNIDVNRGYRGKSMDNTHFEKWAFIPFNKKHTMKKKENTCCRSYQNLSQSKKTNFLIPHLQPTSSITLKQYLLRKQRKNSKQIQYYSHLVSPLQAWRKTQQQKHERKSTQQKAFFLTEQEIEHINRLKDFLRIKNKKDEVPRQPHLSKTLKFNTYERDLDSVPVTNMALGKTNLFKIKGQSKKIRNAFGSWAQTQI